LTKNTI